MYKENVCDETRLKTTEINLGVCQVLKVRAQGNSRFGIYQH